MVPVYADPALNERCYGDLQVVLVSQTASAQKITQKFVLFYIYGFYLNCIIHKFVVLCFQSMCVKIMRKLP